LESRRVILHVGSCEPRKNIELILSALKELDDLEPVFVQVGGRFLKHQMQMLKVLDLRWRVIQIPDVTSDQLRAWYQIADVFVLPSLYEGFGLTVLEAMACRVPVVCVATSSLLEVAGDAVLLIDPHKPIELAQAIRTIFSDSAVASDFCQRGMERAKGFTWERCARKTLNVYEQVIE